MRLSESVIPVEPGEAEEKLAEYTEIPPDQRTPQDEAIAMGYRAAKRGRPIIRLSQAIAAGDYHDNGMPKIAVTRAGVGTTVCYAHYDGEDVIYCAGDLDWRANRGALVNECTVRVHLPNHPNDRTSYWTRASTIVPLIPPKHRLPWRRLHRTHILWEVESWTRQPPIDPALIKHIGGDLWAVLAEWDLTPLERFVLSQR